MLTAARLVSFLAARRAVLLPFSVYVAVTLGIPLANGGAVQAEFWRHALEVSCVAGALVLLRLEASALTRSAS